MSAEGYNVVRFNISSPEAGDLEHGVWGLYMANIADFMRRAKAHGIYVMPTTIGVPFLGGYQLRIADSEHFGSHVNRIPDNSIILSPEGVAAKRKYVRDLLAGTERDAAGVRRRGRGGRRVVRPRRGRWRPRCRRHR